MGKIVQIDDGPQLIRHFKFLWRRIIGGKHDVVARKATGLRQHQLCLGRAVGAAAHVLKDL